LKYLLNFEQKIIKKLKTIIMAIKRQFKKAKKTRIQKNIVCKTK